MTSTFLHTVDNHIFCCEICNDRFDLQFKVPKKMGCKHIICQQCLRNVHLSKDDFGYITCRACGSETPMEVIKDELNRLRLLELLDHKCEFAATEQLCGNCNPHMDTAPAEFGCIHCESEYGDHGVLMCSNCATSHNSVKSLRSHLILPIKEYLGRIHEVAWKQRRECPSHKNVLDKCCETCRISICGTCLTYEHVNHKVISREEGNFMGQNRIVEAFQFLSESVVRTSTQFNTIYDGLCQIEDCSQQLHSHVDRDVDTLISLLETKRKSAHAAIDTLTQQIAGPVNACLDEFERHVLRGKCCKDFVRNNILSTDLSIDQYEAALWTENVAKIFQRNEVWLAESTIRMSDGVKTLAIRSTNDVSDMSKIIPTLFDIVAVDSFQNSRFSLGTRSRSPLSSVSPTAMKTAITVLANECTVSTTVTPSAATLSSTDTISELSDDVDPTQQYPGVDSGRTYGTTKLSQSGDICISESSTTFAGEVSALVFASNHLMPLTTGELRTPTGEKTGIAGWDSPGVNADGTISVHTADAPPAIMLSQLHENASELPSVAQSSIRPASNLSNTKSIDITPAITSLQHSHPQSSPSSLAVPRLSPAESRSAKLMTDPRIQHCNSSSRTTSTPPYGLSLSLQSKMSKVQLTESPSPTSAIMIGHRNNHRQLTARGYQINNISKSPQETNHVLGGKSHIKEPGSGGGGAAGGSPLYRGRDIAVSSMELPLQRTGLSKSIGVSGTTSLRTGAATPAATPAAAAAAAAAATSTRKSSNNSNSVVRTRNNIGGITVSTFDGSPVTTIGTGSHNRRVVAVGTRTSSSASLELANFDSHSIDSSSLLPPPPPSPLLLLPLPPEPSLLLAEPTSGTPLTTTMSHAHNMQTPPSTSQLRTGGAHQSGGRKTTPSSASSKRLTCPGTLSEAECVGEHVRMLGIDTRSRVGLLRSPSGIAFHSSPSIASAAGAAGAAGAGAAETEGMWQKGEKMGSPNALPLAARMLYVVEYDNHCVQMFDADNCDTILPLATIGAGEGDKLGYMKRPSSLALLETGGYAKSSVAGVELFVSDSSNNRIQVFDAQTGTPLRCIYGGPAGSSNSLNGPNGLALLTTSPALHHSHRVVGGAARGGRAVGSVERSRVASGESTTIESAVLTSSTLLFVAEYRRDRVQVFDASSGAYIRSIGSGRGSGPGQMKCPYGVAVLQVDTRAYHQCQASFSRNPHSPSCAYSNFTPRDDNSNRTHALLYVADSDNHRVSVFNAVTGAFIRTIGAGHGAGPDQLNGPAGVAVHIPSHTFPFLEGKNDGDCYNSNSSLFSDFCDETSDELNDLSAHRPQLPQPPVYTSQNTIASYGMRPLLFVADTDNHRVQVFHALTGAYAGSIGIGHGAGSGQLFLPVFLTVHENVRNGTTELFVSESGNNRVQVFRLSL